MLRCVKHENSFITLRPGQSFNIDCLKVGVINCLDNSPTENYIYLVCVVTGWWRDAGTTANVFIFLKGMYRGGSGDCL